MGMIIVEFKIEVIFVCVEFDGVYGMCVECVVDVVVK